jgi:hypothetical protein
MAGATGLEPATFDVTGRVFIQRFQRLFRLFPRRDTRISRPKSERARDRAAIERCSMKNIDLSELPPEMADTVRAFRRELIAEREEQERRLREALDHFKREMEIEIAVYRRLVEIFKGMWPSDDMAARAASLP